MGAITKKAPVKEAGAEFTIDASDFEKYFVRKTLPRSVVEGESTAYNAEGESFTVSLRTIDKNATWSKYAECPLFDSNGKKVGKLVDALLNPESGVITGALCSKT